MRHVETISGMEEGGKGQWWGVWIQLWYIVRNFVNVTMYPHTTLIKINYFKKGSTLSKSVLEY
jgi:hypothetical protein